MHEIGDFFYFIITFSYTKYFVQSNTVDEVFTLSYLYQFGVVHYFLFSIH